MFERTFTEVNPCTGEEHLITIRLEEFLHDQGDPFVLHAVTKITTSPTGFSGGGTATVAESRGAFVFRLVEIMSDEAGNRISAKTVVVEDPATGTVRVERSELTCVHAAA